MSALIKFWIYISLFAIFSAQLVIHAYAQEMIIEPSLSPAKNNPSTGNLGRLFEETGISHPARMNPCFDLSGHASKYCTPNSIHLLTEDPEVSEMSKDFLEKVLEKKNACELVSDYIGRLCHQENFKKIFKHFSK